MLGFARRLQVGISTMVALALGPPTLAQTTWDESTTSVPFTSDNSFPTAVVSTMSIITGDWLVKPVYTIGTNNTPHVIGLLVSSTQPANGSNLLSIWYERPVDDCGPWAATTWEGGKPWDAVTSLKTAYGIQDIQDDYWEVGSSTSGGTEKDYTYGFTADDPIGDLVNARPDRDAIVEYLKDAGYPVADVPFEKDGDDVATMWLVTVAQMFDAMIGQSLENDSLLNASMDLDHPPDVFDPDAVCNDVVITVCGALVHYWLCHCHPHDIRGEWMPDGDLCGCHTIGPYCVASGTITAQADGEVEIEAPWGKVKIHVTAGATVNYCVCATRRTCVGSAHRTVVHVDINCNRTTTTESIPNHTFEKWFYTITADSTACGLSGIPTRCPPDSTDCGLEVP